jgi:type II secretory pathway pseudopilin PulG
VIALMAVLLILGAAVLIWYRHVVRRRQKRELAFALRVADAMARKARIRPKAYVNVQRRRYAR